MTVTESSSRNIRQPVVAGSFYTAHSQGLSDEIEHYLNNVATTTGAQKPIGLICPHAGYLYSGQVAAYAYKIIQNFHYSTVIVLAPSHRTYFNGVSVDCKEGYRTPLGVVPVDTSLANHLLDSCPLASYHEQAHAHEHSLEVQIPFLQKVLEDFSLVPIIMGDQDIKTCETVAQAIVEVVQDKNVLIVASSDLSHYYPYDQAKALDQQVINRINAYDPYGLAFDLRRRKIEACGGGPIITALLVAKPLGAVNADVVMYANSGDVSGDYSGVVGYAAGVIY